MLRIIPLFALFLLASLPIEARMYQWQDPDSGTTQLSGKPPAWYRSTETGPRVIVFEKGRIVDDTNIKIPDAEREAMRTQALSRVEEDKEKAKQMALEAEKLKSMSATDVEEKAAVTDEQAEGTEEPAVTEEQPAAKDELPGMEGLTEEDMRALISEWEKQRTEQAKQKLGEDLSNPAQY